MPYLTALRVILAGLIALAAVCAAAVALVRDGGGAALLWLALGVGLAELVSPVPADTWDAIERMTRPKP